MSRQLRNTLGASPDFPREARREKDVALEGIREL